jgi:tRNA G18 (ribose-2'-O)-methylase SpoU
MRLPIEGKVESLNAAVAGSIGLYLIHQARNR